MADASDPTRPELVEDTKKVVKDLVLFEHRRRRRRRRQANDLRGHGGDGGGGCYEDQEVQVEDDEATKLMMNIDWCGPN